MPMATRMQAGERREQLLDATKAIVAERGFHAVSIEAVAREAGITRPIVYGHFRDLPGLLEALVERETARALAQLQHRRARRARRRPARAAARQPAHLPRGRARRPRHLAARADAARGRAADPPRPDRAGPRRGRSSSSRAPSARGLESPDPELFAHTLSAISDEGARLLLTDPERYPVERIVSFAGWLMRELAP